VSTCEGTAAAAGSRPGHGGFRAGREGGPAVRTYYYDNLRSAALNPADLPIGLHHARSPIIMLDRTKR